MSSSFSYLRNLESNIWLGGGRASVRSLKAQPDPSGRTMQPTQAGGPNVLMFKLTNHNLPFASSVEPERDKKELPAAYPEDTKMASKPDIGQNIAKT